VYLLPTDLSADGANVAKPVADVTVPGMVTDASALSNRMTVLVRTYTDAVFYRMPGWRRVATMSLPLQRQGESLAVDGSGLLIGTEGLPSPLIEVPLSRAASNRLHARPAGTSAPAAPTSSADTAQDPGAGAIEPDPAWPARVVGATTVALGGAWLWVRRRQRNRSTT